ncbi:MAG TPA: S9 family peptidase [Armatimonadota bacterium]|jgi:dipeptidyl aminopeptidase/acylaminoacyl peptidase
MARPIQADDVLDIQTVLDPRISPDGRRVAFVVKRADVKKNKYFTSLWLASADGRTCRAFTAGDHHDSDPRWSPDGSAILFISDRGEDETSQLYLIPTDGGEAHQITSLPQGSLSDACWSPDGKTVAFCFHAVDERDTKKAVEARKKDGKSDPPREITRLRFREEGSGWLPQQRGHIWLLDVAAGEPRQLTHSENGEREPRFSPDGATIAYVANRRPDPDLEPLFDDIFLIPATGGEERRLETPAGPKGAPEWSPDGARIAYAGHEHTDDTWGTRNVALWSVPAAGGAAVNHTAGFDRPLGDYTLGDIHSFGAGAAGPFWLGSDAILFIASVDGAAHLMRAALGGGGLQTLVGGERCVMAVSVSPSGQAAVAIGSAAAPAEVFTFDPARGGEPKRISNLNGPLLRRRAVGQPVAFQAKGKDGVAVPGWYLTPPDFDPSRKYPMILEIHGGPHTQYGWSFMHEFQFLAAQGFVVAYANPRGSQGYGEAWAGAIRGHWGDPDLDDQMAVVDHMVGLGFVDPERLGVTGGSYGGFMTGWVVGHTTRFRAAISDRGVYSLVSMAGTCDFPWDERYFQGHPWEWAAALRKHSPLTYAANVTTPLLILHSEGDLRCPIEQADQFYAALRTMGKTVKYLRFPADCNHGLSRGGPPDSRLARLKHNRDWMTEHLG